MPPGIFVSLNPDRLDVAAMTEWIRGSYWGGWQTPEQIRAAIAHSIVFGAYYRTGPGVNAEQVGFARIVTDHAAFASVTDVYVSVPWRGKGVGRMLMEAVCEHEAVKRCICILATQPQTEGFYEKFGFGTVNGIVLQRSPVVER